jgi:hypothetical protein
MHDQPAHALFTVTWADGRCEVRPASLWSQLGYVFFALGGAFCVYLAGTFLLRAGERSEFLLFGGVPLVGAGLLFWQAVRYWQLRRTPLVAEGNGRVSYGGREVCPAGSVRAVRIVPDPTAEHGDCKVVLDVAGGRQASLPLPYFGAISNRDLVRGLAADLARALRVEVVETT